jgi:ABC-type multidrug transport system fused ATPase/permease subunit
VKILTYLFGDMARVLSVLNNALRIRAFFLFLLMMAQSILELLFINSITTMGVSLSNPDFVRASFPFPLIFAVSPAIEAWSTQKHMLLLLAGVVIVVIAILKNLVNYLTAKATALLGEDIAISVGSEILQRFLYRDYAWHLSSESGTMYQRMLWRMNLAMLLTSLLFMYSSILTVIILFVSLVTQEFELMTMVVSITSFIGFLLYRGIRGLIDRCAKDIASAAQAETQALLCATKGIREVLIYRQQTVFLDNLRRATLQGRLPRTFQSIAPTLPTWVLEATGFFMVVMAVAYLVFVMEADNTRITSALALLVLTAWRVLPYCNRVVSYQVTIRALRPTSEAVIDLLTSLRNNPSEPPPQPDPEFRFSNRLDLCDISFRYPGAQSDSLKDISLTLKKGKKIGIVGPSGAGKSTLVGVMSGLLPPGKGFLSVDGLPLTPSGSAALAAQIGYVPQSPFLFGGTLADNIAFSEWGKPWDKARVEEACRKASIDFVDTHPGGLLQPIGENGSGLSGGQAQRVSIARAMYTQPSLLIFDEATSSLDQANEDSIQHTLETLAEEITCVIIAHRLNSVAACDEIIWLDKGSIVMKGRPEEVLPLYENAHRIS